MATDCTFCQPENRHYVLENAVAGMLFDTNPVSRGHALIITKDHYATIFDTPLAVRTGMAALLDDVKALLDERFHPAGYNLDINVGRAGGQAIMHTHLHVIPRYLDDEAGDAQSLQAKLPPAIVSRH